MAKSSPKTEESLRPPAKPERIRRMAGRELRHRVMVDGEFVFGPGKADVLTAIDETGSLAAAGRLLGMSYMRIWRLCQGMYEQFNEPVIAVQRGGRDKGGAVLTQTGREALALYRQMETDALAATELSWQQFRKLLKPR